MAKSKKSASPSNNVKLISKAITDITSKTHLFASPNSECSNLTLSLSQSLYSFASSQELSYPLCENLPENTKGFNFGLDNLILEGFDADQVWQQLQLRNEPFFQHRAKPVINNLLGEASSDIESSDNESAVDVSEDALNSDELPEESDNSVEDLENIEEEIESDQQDVAFEESDMELEKDSKDSDNENDGQSDVISEEERTEVDDDFFSLHRMHKMIDAAEEAELNEESDKESDDVDLNQDPDELDSDDAPADEIKFSDFFKGSQKKSDTSNQRKVRFADDSSKKNKPKNLLEDSDDEDFDSTEVDVKPSSFEKKQMKMAQMIEQLEEENVAAKPWTLMGEASAWNRPKDSLLEEDLEFDHASKPAPVVTVEVTQSLEELIQQRILNSQFDDVVKPLKEKKRPQFTSEEVELNMEKSKKSLAEVYEDEYQKATSGASKSDDIPPEVLKAHEEIDALFFSVSSKLDALSNSHYAPKMPKIEVQVVKDLPAISMEEAIPVAVSDATLLAPEEIYAQDHHGQAGLVQTSQELSPEERKRIRNRKKRLAKVRSKNHPKAPAPSKPAVQKS